MYSKRYVLDVENPFMLKGEMEQGIVGLRFALSVLERYLLREYGKMENIKVYKV